MQAEPTQHVMSRLLELAQDAARRAHLAAVEDPNTAYTSHHRWIDDAVSGFDLCPHPDCVLANQREKS
jgi:hypothetical protein